MKEAIFHLKARKVIRTFPSKVKQGLGQAILELQKGFHLSMPLSKPMPTVAIGVEEIRIKDDSGIFRTLYFKKSSQGILIFHAFVKKTQKTPNNEIKLARKRLEEMLNEEIKDDKN